MPAFSMIAVVHPPFATCRKRDSMREVTTRAYPGSVSVSLDDGAARVKKRAVRPAVGIVVNDHDPEIGTGLNGGERRELEQRYGSEARNRSGHDRAWNR